MAIVRIPDEDRIVEAREVREVLAAAGIDHQRWEPAHPVAADAPAEEVLRAYAREIEALKRKGGYVAADVIDVNPGTAGLEEMRAKFRREHWHDEDEVRFILAGSGLFFIHPRGRPVLVIEVGPGDLMRIPRGTQHWFEFCPRPEIRAIRLFQDPSGWAPRYTDSGLESRYEPVCLGPAYLPGPGAGS